MAFAAVGALVAGEAAVSIGTVLAASAEIGTALSVVGAVTGSKDLMKAGGLMGLVGGVGSMISGGASSAASLGSVATKAATEIAGDQAQGSGFGTGSEYYANPFSGGIGDYPIESSFQSEFDKLGQFNNDLNKQAQSGMQMPMNDIQGQNQQQSMALNTPSQTIAATESDGLQAPVVSGAQSPGDVTDGMKSRSEILNMFGPEQQDTGGFFNSLTQFAEKNKTIFNTGMIFLGGAMKGISEQKKIDAQNELMKERLKQTSYGSAFPGFAPSTGIIQGAR